MKVPFGYPIINSEEKSAVAKVLSNPILVHGPKSKEFEKNFSHYTKSPYAITVSSCTTGMHLIYFSLGFGKGHEIIVSSQTHVSTAHAIELTGAKAVFVDRQIWMIVIQSRIGTNTILILMQMEVFIVYVNVRP